MVGGSTPCLDETESSLCHRVNVKELPPEPPMDIIGILDANDPKTRTRQMNESFNSRPCVWINDRVHLPTESSADVSATQSELISGKSPGTSIPLYVHPDMNGNLRSC
ncbi:unnamed protein product [Pleuronectes platessa]|uniref:Uncharacterized protein n=1 Tax=Pleuronectes platessa TaxID=8262 RepID=A0A9N7V6C5_PLEPL|nr:unnamed protein product [Pleuronectes platessa]